MAKITKVKLIEAFSTSDLEELINREIKKYSGEEILDIKFDTYVKKIDLSLLDDDEDDPNVNIFSAYLLIGEE